MKIAVSGTQGTGKTTKVFELALEYKRKYPNKTVHIIQENVVKCPLPFNENGTMETQLWIATDQMKAEIEASQMCDIVICDRCVFDPIAYSMSNNLNDTTSLLYEFLKRWGKTYDINYLMDGQKHHHVYDDGLRSINDEFRCVVDKNFKSIFKSLNAGGYLNEMKII